MHRVEVFILDENGEITAMMLDQLRAILKNGKQEVRETVPLIGAFRKRLHGAGAVVLQVLVAFFPKCPAYWAAYLSIFGVGSISTIPYAPWLLPVFIVLLMMNLGILYWQSKKRNGRVPFLLASGGASYFSPGSGRNIGQLYAPPRDLQ